MMGIKSLPASKLTVDEATPSDQQGMLRCDNAGNIYEYVMIRSTTVLQKPVWRVSQLGARNGSTNGMVTPTKAHGGGPGKAYGFTVGTITAGQYGYIFKCGIPANLRTKSAATLKGLLLVAYNGLVSSQATNTLFSDVVGYAKQTPAGSTLAYGAVINVL